MHACMHARSAHSEVRVPQLLQGGAGAPVLSGRQPRLLGERHEAASPPQLAGPPEAVPREAELREALLPPHPLDRMDAKHALPAKQGGGPPSAVEGVARRHDDLLRQERVGVEELAPGGARAREHYVAARVVPRRQAYDGALGVLVERGGPRARILRAGSMQHHPVHLPGGVNSAVHVELRAADEEHPPRLGRGRGPEARRLRQVSVEGGGPLVVPDSRVREALV
mmetsp:Transcript_106152/g.331128  ORF Transcript_106152/g.331128 Transcript_106152/m.331128 type:complete len:225 (+) Transcript_106152:855-1529(+)